MTLREERFARRLHPCYIGKVQTAAARGAQRVRNSRIFYGWYIVAVGFLANVASSFALASTLSIFLKPLTAELGISRGVFSLLRSGEGIIAAVLAPLIGTMVDRFGGRWLMVTGAAITLKVMAPHRQRPVPNGLADMSTPQERLAAGD